MSLNLDDYARIIRNHQWQADDHLRSKRIMIARACEFYSCREVAQALDLSPGTVWRICDEVGRGKLAPGRPGPERSA